MTTTRPAVAERMTAGALLIVFAVLAVAVPARADLADDIRERIDIALGWLVPTNYHEDAGFYAPHQPHWFWVFDTVQVVWLLDWLEEQGWDVAEYTDEVENARAFLDDARAEDGSWYWEGPSEIHRDTETTALASLLAPSPLSDQWIVDHQLPDGHWDELAPTVEDQDYPTSTGFAMYAATCRNYDVDFEKAYEWYESRSEADWYPSGDFYKTRFYATYLLGSLAKLRDDFPDEARVKLREIVTYYHDGNGSFEGRTMDDNPSAIIPVAMAMQTAIQLDDPALEDEIYLAGVYLRENFA
ncbi:MAG: terpene cyclase/mutase family protein, partial [Deltaproteobacteria bacterium]|nr:terpene cyclase/mutase family protein [Deltaproteobacteria bacterium]